MDATCIIKRLVDFLRDAAGNIGVMFCLSAIPVLLALGSATDLVSANNMKARMQAAVDAAALAAATAGDLHGRNGRIWPSNVSTRTLPAVLPLE